MAKVCAKADVIVPNLTEASLLTGLPYRTEYDEEYIRQMLQALAKLGPRYVALTGVSFEPEKLGVMYYDQQTGQYGSYFNERLPVAIHGTGDVFASTCVGALMRASLWATLWLWLPTTLWSASAPLWPIPSPVGTASTLRRSSPTWSAAWGNSILFSFTIHLLGKEKSELMKSKSVRSFYKE